MNEQWNQDIVVTALSDVIESYEFEDYELRLMLSNFILMKFHNDSDAALNYLALYNKKRK